MGEAGGSSQRLHSLERLVNPPAGHPHFWRRAISRRKFLAMTGGTVGTLAAADLLGPFAGALAGQSGSGEPKPIPNGIIPGFHFFLPARSDDPLNGEQSSIFDFDGDLGVIVIEGQGTGSQGGVKQALFYDVDMRFMKGDYVDRVGQQHHATFGFV